MTMDNGNIRWDQPIEAVHEDGRVVGARIEDPSQGPLDQSYGVRRDDGKYMHVTLSGHRYSKDCDDGWTIRNVVEAKAAEAPETHRQVTNGVRTSQECLERMEALVRRMALADGVISNSTDYREAAAIVRDLPEPVDPDLVEAREIMEARYYINDPEWQGDLDTTRAFKLLKRGRALERGEG